MGSRRRIGETRARAHYFSNVGAELLAGGDAAQALKHFEHALELDPDFQPARVNMAVAYRRLDRPEEAEATLLDVLAAEPNTPVAAANLAGLYIAWGREADALKWLEQRRGFLDGNPFHHFRLGMGALRDDVPKEARLHFKRAIDLQPRESVFYEQLANAYLRLGRRATLVESRRCCALPLHCASRRPSFWLLDAELIQRATRRSAPLPGRPRAPWSRRCWSMPAPTGT